VITIGSLLATVVDVGALARTVAAAFVSGVGITLIFSLAILGVSRLGEEGRAGRSGHALFYGAVTAVAGVAFVAAIAIGIIVMTAK
jgi:hypothetical protein